MGSYNITVLLAIRLHSVIDPILGDNVMNSMLRIVFILFISVIAAGKEVAPDDPALWVTGAKYTRMTPDGVEFLS